MVLLNLNPVEEKRMRMRFAIISTLVIVLGACGVLWHQRARAEHVRLALYQERAPANQRGSASAEATEKVPTTTPPANALPGAAIEAAPPAAVEPSTTPPLLPARPGGGFGGFAPPATVIAAPGAAPPGVTVQVAPVHPYGPSAPMLYPGAPQGTDPETNELTSQDQQFEQEVQSLVRQLATADEEKTKSELKDMLAATLERQFDTQQKLRQLEISRIQSRVDKLRGLLQKRTESRRKMIDNRLEQLLNDADGLGWSSGTASGVQYVPHALPGGFGPPKPATPPALAPPVAVPAPRRS
jgi:hypothetical protein